MFIDFNKTISRKGYKHRVTGGKLHALLQTYYKRYDLPHLNDYKNL